MFDLITDVPNKILEFYHEEVRSEPTGNQIPETYTYVDENGDTQTGTRMVDEYADVTYVVENTRCQPVSFSQVDNIIELRAGTLPDVVDTFIGFALETKDWEYHDSYLEYLALEPNADDPKYLEEVPGSDPIEYVYDYINDRTEWLLAVPDAKDPTVTISEWKITNYDKLRKAAYGSWQEQMEMQYDGTWNDHLEKVRDMYPKNSIS